MKHRQSLALSVATLFVLMAAAIAQVRPAATSTAPLTRPGTRPATGPTTTAVIPSAVIDELTSQFAPPPRRLDPDESLRLLEDRMQRVLELGASIEQQYAGAAELAGVRLIMLRAAYFLAERATAAEKADASPAAAQKAQAARQRVVQVAQRVMDSDAPPAYKINADLFLTRHAIGADTGQPAADAPQQIRAMARRYENTEAYPQALQAALVLAKVADYPELVAEFGDGLDKNHSSPDVRMFLHEVDYFVGKPFEASVVTLDGQRLSLPQDYKGKVLVVDFWASWCQPCVMAAPHLKRIYDEYRYKNVEFIGISLDDSKEALQKFVRDNNLPWPQVFSGLPRDPLAAHYGVFAIPSVWVIGPDGRVVSSGADPLPPIAGEGYSKLDLAIQQALGGEAAGPAAGATTKPSGAAATTRPTQPVPTQPLPTRPAPLPPVTQPAPRPAPLPPAPTAPPPAPLPNSGASRQTT
jgi:thiol-disulfide isomerase/thioredoxin